MANKINYCDLNSSKMAIGVNKISEAVRQTFGPKGKCVAIETSFGSPDITRDGATVAKAIVLKDKIENMGAELVKKAAQSTEEQAGDGTSTSCILTNEIIKSAQSLVKLNTNLNDVKRGMEMAAREITETIKSSSVAVDNDLEKIRQVATVSANNDSTVGDLIVECMEKVGINGVITADVSKGIETKIDVTTGFKISRGWASPNFVTSPKEGKSILEKPAIAVIGERLSTISQVQPLIQNFVQAFQGKPLVIICDDIDDSILTFFLYNHLNGALKSCIIKGVDFGDNRKNIMEDIAICTGATFVCSEYGLELKNCGPEILGTADYVTVSKDSTIIREGGGDPDSIKSRIEILKERLSDQSLPNYDKTKFEDRIASLSGAIGIIRAGGASETEAMNKKATIEDAILAAKSAIDEGVVPGSGSVYLRAFLNKPIIKDISEDTELGRQIVYNSLPEITKIIAENAGAHGDSVIETIIKNKKKPNFGYNAKTGVFGNLIDMGILDSAKVLRVSIENAVSAASMVVMCSCTITNIEENNNCCCCSGN